MLNTNICLPKMAGDSAIRISQAIAKKYDSFFTLNDQDCYPHITIYMTKFPIKNLDSIQEELEETIRNMAKFKISLTETYANPNTFIGIHCKKDDVLTHLHETIVNNLNKYREGLTPEEDPTFLSESQKTNLLKYGYIDAFENYWPHLTISRLKTFDEAIQAKEEIKVENNEFIVTHIGLFVVGENVSAKKLIKLFELK